MPDTLGYLILGLGVTALTMGALVASIWVRASNARKDLELIQRLSEEE